MNTKAVKPTQKPKKPKAKAPGKSVAPKSRHPYKLNEQSWDKNKVADIVCNAIATSSKSIATILGAGHDGRTLPDYATFARWLGEADCDWLRDQYARAKEAQADFMAEEMAELHEKAWVPIILENGEPLKDKDGKLVRTVNKASAAAVRLEADNKKWLMAKLKPKKYGEKVETTHTGPNGGPIQARIAIEFVKPKPVSEDDA